MTSNLSRYVPLFLAAAAACGGQTQPNPSQDTAAIWQQYCQKYAAWRTTCGQPATDTCAADVACMQGVLRADMAETLTNCLVTRACKTNDDACYDMAAAVHEADPAVTAYTTACINKHTAC